MLVLSRFSGQRIIIREGDREWSFKVMQAEYGKVRLSFDAPPDVKILREEVAERDAESLDADSEVG